jgi:C1A family cysteine protease
MSGRRYGWRPDLPDAHDRYALRVEALMALPPLVDLRSFCPPVYDQGNLGSCTGNAIAGALELDQIRQKVAVPFVPSRLFIYYGERVIEGTVQEDAGAMIRDGLKVVVKQGAPHEKLWPYITSRFARKPPAKAYADALHHRAIQYMRVPQTEQDLRACLASGSPVVFGFTVYESFESSAVEATGIVPLPTSDETRLGGHAVLAVGYDDTQRTFLVRNSWGASWGQAGYCTMPYDYVLNNDLADDFWTIQRVA